MKKSFLLLWCCLSTFYYIAAKNNAYLPPDETVPRIVLTADTNTVLIDSQLCIKVLAYGFQDIDSLQMSIVAGGVTSQFDTLRQSETTAGIANFTNANGYLNITWKNATSGVTLPDESVLFEICVKGLAAGESGMSIVNYPTFVKAFSDNGQVQELAYNAEDWRFTYYVFPEESIALALTDTVTTPGEQVCLRLEVIAFEERLVGMQFGIKWDEKMLHLDSIKFGNIANLNNIQNFGLTHSDEGKLLFAWTDQSLVGIQLNQGDRFFEMCFQVLDTTGATAVYFSQEALPFEFFDIDLNLYNIAADNSEVYISEDPMMRPGDTNRDGIVNHVDLLNIGLGYGSSGPTRKNGSLAWQNQLVGDWAAASPLSQINYKHFDSDGNGLIEALDVLAIDANWHQTDQNFQAPDPIQIRATGAPFYIKPQQLFPEGQSVALDIILGEASQPATDVYGVAFSIVYDELLLAPGDQTVFATFDTSWLGKTGEDLLVFQKNDPAAKRMDIALVRVDGANRNGFGAIGQLHFTLPAYVGEEPADTVGLLPFRIENVHAIDVMEIEQPTTPMETTTVLDISTGINDAVIAKKVRIFPNPTSELLQVQTDRLMVLNLELRNAQGQLIMSYPADTSQISTHNLPAGLYTLRMLTTEGTVVKPFIKR